MATESEENRSTDGGRRILVVDDEEIIHASLARILGRQGHFVDPVFEAQQALERLDAESYDLVITDLMMPGMNGIELMEKMQVSGLEVPVVMITGYPTIKTAVQALRLGAVDYLAKPFTRVELMGPVCRALRKGGVPEDPPTDTNGELTEGLDSPDLELLPGDRFRLREHSWAIFRQDGVMEIGIEPAFLEALDRVVSADLPDQNDVIEQGFVTFKLKTDRGEEHSVFAPLSGHVVEVNERIVAEPGAINAELWLIRIIPNRLKDELPLLLRAQ